MADLARQMPREAAEFRERKVWQADVLQSSALGSAHAIMAIWAVEKAPFCATFRHFFVDFPRLFSASLPLIGALGANSTSKCASRFRARLPEGFSKRYNDRSAVTERSHDHNGPASGSDRVMVGWVQPTSPRPLAVGCNHRTNGSPAPGRNM
jgi:hypothetical protein